jgi:hypothetical protein
VEDKGEVLVVNGRGAKCILARRVVWDKQVLKGDVQKVMEAILYQYLAREIDNPDPKAIYMLYNFVLRKSYDEIETTAFGKKLSEWMMEVLQAREIGWRVFSNRVKYNFPAPAEYTGKYLYWLSLEVFDGDDLTSTQSTNKKVIFSKANNNLLNFEYKYSKQNYANRIMIAGEGEGVNQSVAEYSYDNDAQGINIYESYVDGSSVKSDIVVLEPEYLALLRAYGKEQNNINNVYEFSCNVDPNTTYKLGKDYRLGDIVEVDTDIGVKAKARIVEFIWSYDENGYTVVPTFSDWEIIS